MRTKAFRGRLDRLKAALDYRTSARSNASWIEEQLASHPGALDLTKEFTAMGHHFVQEAGAWCPEHGYPCIRNSEAGHGHWMGYLNRHATYGARAREICCRLSDILGGMS
jgi:hypothetical protein